MTTLSFLLDVNAPDAQKTFDAVAGRVNLLDKQLAKTRELSIGDKGAMASLLRTQLAADKLRDRVTSPMDITIRGAASAEARLLELEHSADRLRDKLSKPVRPGLLGRIGYGVIGGQRGTGFLGRIGNLVPGLTGTGGGASGFGALASAGSGLANPYILATLAAAAAATAPFAATFAGGLGVGTLGAGLAGLGIYGALSGGSGATAAQVQAAALRVTAAQQRLAALQAKGAKAGPGSVASAQAALVSAQAAQAVLQAPSPGAAAARKSITDFVQTAQADLVKISTPFQKVIENIAGAFTSVLPKLMTPLGAALSVIAKPLQIVGTTLASSFGSPRVKQAIELVGAAFSRFLTAFAPQIPGIVNSIATGIASMADAFLKHPDMIVAMGKVIAFLFKLPGYAFSAIGALTNVAHWLATGLPHEVSRGVDDTRKFFENLWLDVRRDFDDFNSFWIRSWDAVWAHSAAPAIRGLRGAESAFGGFTHAVTAIFDGFGRDIAAKWDSLWAGTIGGWWKTHGAEVTQAFRAAWDGISKVFRIGSAVVTTAWKATWSVLSLVFKVWWDILTTEAKIAWTVLSTVFKVGAAVITAAWKVWWGGIEVIAKIGWDVIATVFKVAFSVIEGIAKIGWDIIAASAKVAWAVIRATLKIAWDTIVVIFSVFLDLVTGHWSRAWDDIRRYGQQVWNAIRGFFSTAWSAFGTLAKQAWGHVRDTIVGIWNSAWGGAKSAWGTAWRWISGIPGIIAGLFRNSASWLYTLGKGILSGLLAGAKSVWNDVLNFFKGIPGAILHALGIKSPPDWAIAAGKHIMDGIGIGLDKAKNAVTGILGTITGITGSGSASGAYGGIAGTYGSEKAYAASLLGGYGWSPMMMNYLIPLWQRESGWNPYAVNPSSGAYGIPQALGKGHPYNLGDWMAQIRWGLRYIFGRYGSPLGAWLHEQQAGWYDFGGLLKPGLTLALNTTGRDEYVTRTPPGRGGGSVTNHYSITVNVPPGTHPAQTAKAVIEQIKEYERINGKGWRNC